VRTLQIGFRSLRIDGDDHHAIYFDEKGHRGFVGRWRSFDGMPERGDFLLRCQPGSKRCIFGADWNSVRRERAQIRPQVSIRTNFARFRGPDCFEDKRRPAVNLKGKYLKRTGRVWSRGRFAG
jgi:hypothetical protein